MARRVQGAKYKRMPHGDSRADSLWWLDLPHEKRDAVLAAYLKQCSRGRKLPEDFGLELEQWLRDLNKKQTRHKWWTIPAYALANKLKPHTLMKRCRELDAIAKEMFAPQRIVAPLTEEKIAAIRERYSELIHDWDVAKKVANEFHVEPFRVGQLCKDLKDADKAEREVTTQTQADPDYDPFPEKEQLF